MREKPYILVVDDEAVNRTVLNKALSQRYHVELAENGYDAVRSMKENAPDLIILDVMMPGMTGFEVCRLIKSEESLADIPVIFLTALASNTEEITGLQLGAIDYLTKPVDLQLLRLRVENHVELKRRNDVIRSQRDTLEIQKRELHEAYLRIKKLEGIITICMYCKSIRNEEASWQQLETYISEHSDALFSHGVCPQCAEEKLEMLRKP